MKILEARSVYRACASDVAKSQIAQSIKDYVCIILGGRFLNLDDQTKRWFVLPDNVVLDKVRECRLLTTSQIEIVNSCFFCLLP